jgi:hypothetical protein
MMKPLCGKRFPSILTAFDGHKKSPCLRSTLKSADFRELHFDRRCHFDELRNLVEVHVAVHFGALALTSLICSMYSGTVTMRPASAHMAASSAEPR